MKRVATAALCVGVLVAGDPLSGLAQDVVTTHRLSAGLAAEAVAEAVAACAMRHSSNSPTPIRSASHHSK